jgi:hypothetical protein
MMATDSSGDESSDDEMLQKIIQQAAMTSSIWIWDAMQLCAMDMIEVENDKPRIGRDQLFRKISLWLQWLTFA